MKMVEGPLTPFHQFFPHRAAPWNCKNTAFTVWAVDIHKVNFAMNRAKSRTNSE